MVRTVWTVGLVLGVVSCGFTAASVLDGKGDDTDIPKRAAPADDDAADAPPTGDVKDDTAPPADEGDKDAPRGDKGGGKDTSTPSTPTSRCNNGVKEAGEECDIDDFGGETCVSLGFARGALSCTLRCKIDTSACSGTGGSTGGGGSGGASGGGSGSSGTFSACFDTCYFASDGECDDGGPGSDYDVCGLGSDCTDCGPRTVPTCTDACFGYYGEDFNGDGECDDGLAGSDYDVCGPGTDCTDCGPRR